MSWKRLFGYALVFLLLIPTWFVLGGVNLERSRSADRELSSEVSNLFGGVVAFRPPEVRHHGFTRRVEKVRSEKDDDWVERVHHDPYERVEPLQKHHLDLDVQEERRSKGLVDYRLFTVDAEGAWAFDTSGDESETVQVRWQPPSGSVIEDFVLRVDGEPLQVDMTQGWIIFDLPAHPARRVDVALQLRTRGRSQVGYQGALTGLTTLRDVDVRLSMDTEDYDLPSGSGSPTTSASDGGAATLAWTSDEMITDRSFEVSFEDPMQPGELASRLSFSAPWSLALFVAFIGALVVVRDIDFHPVHLILTGFAFFAFNLLFSYLVDVAGVWPSFCISAAVSVFLVTTYLSRAVSPQFGFRQAGLAQLVFLVGFALANMWDGMTGLSITVTGIATLAAIMQITAKVDWTQALSRDKLAA